jgi:hypothetical protein
MKFMRLSTLAFAALLSTAACGKGGEAPASGAAAAAASADKVDRAALKDGQSHTHNLKFWMKERGLVGNDIVDNVHFDDGANTRVIFTYDAALNDRIAKLEQGKVYKVTFTFKQSDNGMLLGNATAID